jgi:hypothetical protein
MRYVAPGFPLGHINCFLLFMVYLNARFEIGIFLYCTVLCWHNVETCTIILVIN